MLTLRDVDTALATIGATAGRGSMAERKRLLAALLAAATATEQSFLVRLLLGELRQGALEGLMIEAVASAAGRAGRRTCAVPRWLRAASLQSRLLR